MTNRLTAHLVRSRCEEYPARRNGCALRLRSEVSSLRNLRQSGLHLAFVVSIKKLGILYATREGHTRRIAERTANTVRAHGWLADLFDVAELNEAWAVNGYAAVILAASIHRGSHEREMIQFVKRHRTELERVASALLSVSLTQANAQDRSRQPEVRLQAQKDVQRMLDEFYASTGFRPQRVTAVAGALLYSRYNPLIRYIMKPISKRAGGPTDTARDHDFDELAGSGPIHCRVRR